MHEFKLWAPLVKKISVRVGEQDYPMAGPDECGLWTAAVEGAEHGTDFGFVLDADPKVYPDPRSYWQAGGVHGLSRVYEHNRFRWKCDRWQARPLSSAVIYEMHLGTYTPGGTFDSAIERLDHLVDLGITHVEIMPVAAFPGDRGWGYDGVALFAVTENYGGPDGFKRFVDACHERDLGIILDVVYNHFGPVGNYTGKFGPYTTDRHQTPWGSAMNFEGAGSDQVRRFFCDNALMWLRDYRLDGLRLDAIHEMIDRSAIHFLEQLSAEVEVLGAMLGRKLILIAESDLNNPRIVTPREAGGSGMDAQWSDDFHHALFTLLHVDDAGGYYEDFGSFEKLVKSLTDVFVFDGAYSRYRNRSHGRPVDGLSMHRFISFIQNHDQVGNRATGDRLEHIVGADKAKVAAALVLTAPFIPMLFQGEEYAAATPFLYFADHEDPEMAKLVSAGRKKEFAAFGFTAAEVPDPEAQETFQRSKMDWGELEVPARAEMLEWFRKLIALRHGSMSLNDGGQGHTQVRFSEEGRWLEMIRGKVRILCNLGSKPASFEVPPGYRLVLASREETVPSNHQVIVSGESVVILSGESQEFRD